MAGNDVVTDEVAGQVFAIPDHSHLLKEKLPNYGKRFPRLNPGTFLALVVSSSEHTLKE